MSARRDAQTIYYSIASEPAREILKTLYQVYCAPPKASKPKSKTIGQRADGVLRQVNIAAVNFRENARRAAMRRVPTRWMERCVD